MITPPIAAGTMSPGMYPEASARSLILVNILRQIPIDITVARHNAAEIIP